MRARQVEGRGHRPLLCPLAYQCNVAAGTERQRKGVEQDRLAGAGFAGQHGETSGEIDIEPVDQNDVADGKPGEHDAGRGKVSGDAKIATILWSVVSIVCGPPAVVRSADAELL